MRAALELAGRAGICIASVCTGAFAVAATGLLDGRTVTTHWAAADDLAELYPGCASTATSSISTTTAS
ncbi:DJ-1/PfpI family protein [Streptomyces decoyicus]|uniref:DJ-1/PfpI family protein n=1 Tax=Streptomyces decoyicus TaxID=249567 RepID=A0ABZ1FAY8_9ACTN|nr:DJ-1/PfpI family protein [Streptomyces decoyicus]WSB67331.1 DJ-1/PfpI family protein [Streptomyces decoyicus]